MRDDFFKAMKKQMDASDENVYALKYRISAEKRKRSFGYVARGLTAVLCFTITGVLVFNMMMPAAAEQLPVVGKSLESLNSVGKEVRKSGKTPEIFIKETKEDFIIEVSNAECNGLDLKLKIKLYDVNNKITEKSDTVTIDSAVVEIMETEVYPTNEAPRLKKDKDGAFSGWATFNISALAVHMTDGETVEGRLLCENVSAFVEGATYEESITDYKYEFKTARNFEAAVDISSLYIEHLGITKDGMAVEYVLKNGERTDVVFFVDEEIEYAKDFSIYTDKCSPNVITINSYPDEYGRYVYNATFVEGGKEELVGEDYSYECSDAVLVEEPFVLYSHATGEYYVLESEKEAEE